MPEVSSSSLNKTTRENGVAKMPRGEFFVVRVDAPPGVEVPGGCFVTVESGPHSFEVALTHLARPRPKAHTLPEIVFLPTCCTVWALDEKVPAKPRLIVADTSFYAAKHEMQRNDQSGHKERFKRTPDRGMVGSQFLGRREPFFNSSQQRAMQTSPFPFPPAPSLNSNVASLYPYSMMMALFGSLSPGVGQARDSGLGGSPGHGGQNMVGLERHERRTPSNDPDEANKVKIETPEQKG